MFSRFLLICAFSQFFFLVATSENISERSKNLGILSKETERRQICDNIRNATRKKFDSNSQLSDSGELEENFQAVFVDPWYTNLPLLPIVFAKSPTLPHGTCKKQAQRYLNDLRNGTLWATQMFDASTKFPDGLISGHTRHLGDFDGCYNLKVELPNFSYHDEHEEITGRYCIVDIRYEKKNSSPLKIGERHDLVFDPNDSVWEAIREKGDFRRVRRYVLQMALCVPEVCSPSDIETALQGPLETFAYENNMNIEVSVASHLSQARKDVPDFSKAAKIYCAVVGGVMILVVLSTCYDWRLKEYNEKVTSLKKDLILCFSARRNFNSITEPTAGRHRGLETIHLLRFFYLTLTIVGHRTVQYFTGPVINVSYMEWLYKYPQSMMVLAGPQVIDAFFSIGGLLMAFLLLTELDARKRINFLGPIIIRFFRLTPSYVVVIFFNALVLPYLGSGPYWEWKVGLERDSCLNNWWANVFYINNYVNTETSCMFQSWYLAVDYQLFIIALFVVYAFWRMPRKIGYFFLCAIILGGCITPFCNTYFYNVQPLFKGLLDMREIRDDPYFTQHYVKTHERFTPYFIGVLTGAIMYDHSRAPWRLGKVSSNLLFILFAVVCSLGSEMLAHKFYDPNENPTILEAAIYACIYKSAFAVSACAIPALITFGDGLDFHYNFFTPRWVVPLSRLTYGTYLVHSVRQLYDVGVTRSARSFGISNMFWDIVPDLVFSFGLSLLLALTIEGPFRKIEKCFIMKREPVCASNESINQEAKKRN